MLYGIYKLFWKMKLHHSATRAFTLIEVMMSVLLAVVSFAGIFEVNAICLRYVNASKESVGAIQGVQDRIEALRSLAFTDLTSQNYMTVSTGVDAVTGTALPGLLANPANSSDAAKKVAEVVTLTDFTGGTAGSTSVQYNRAAGASVTPTASWSGGGSFPSSTKMLKATVTHSWTMSLGGRARKEMSETIISSGNKK